MTIESTYTFGVQEGLNKNNWLKIFQDVLGEFLTTLKGKYEVIDIKQLKKEIKKLPENHPLNIYYSCYVLSCKRKMRSKYNYYITWKLTDFDRLTKHIRSMKGSFTEFQGKRKLGYMGSQVSVYKTFIRLS